MDRNCTTCKYSYIKDGVYLVCDIDGIFNDVVENCKNYEEEVEMYDRFKFRGWHKELKQMSEVDSLCLYEDTRTKYGEVFLFLDNKHSYYFPEEVEVMQCTGLKDKNGTLIYEGDIVEVQYIGGQIPLFKNEYSKQPETERFEIFCHPEWLKFYAKNDNYRKTCEIHSLDLEKINVNKYNKVYEVIGNIYETPELLKE